MLPDSSLKYLLLLIALLGQGPWCAAEIALRESHDSPTKTWSPVPNRYNVRAVEHQRVQVEDGPQSTGAEYFRFAGPAGYSGMALMPIGSAPVLDDLQIRLRVRSPSPGVVLAMRVVFPRTKDRGTGGPLKAIVRAETAGDLTAEWQQLVIQQAPQLVRRHARVMSGALRSEVDWRESYVDAVAVIVPCDQRGAQIWIDELTIEGLVQAERSSDDPNAQQSQTKIASVALSPRGWQVDGQAFYPRVFTHAGEAMAEVARLGFNTVAFDHSPEPQWLLDAAKAKLWVICPPPALPQLASPKQSRAWAGVLAWRLPGQRDARSLDSSTAEVQALQLADRTLKRPVLAAPTDGWAAWSRLVDGLIVTAPRAPPGQGVVALRSRLEAAQRFASPATPLLAQTSATHSSAFQTQLSTFAPAGAASPWRGPQDLMDEARTAALQGCLGVWVDKDQPLTAGKNDAIRLRYGLALINLRLTLLEPWLRDGKRLGDVATSQATAGAVMFAQGRTKLIVPQPSDRAGSGGPVRLLAPGVSEGDQAYALSDVEVRPIAMIRATGGVQVVLDSSDQSVLLTTDARSAAKVKQRLAAVARRGLALEQALAIAELQHAEAHLSPLVQAPDARTPESAVLSEVRRSISLSKSAQAAQNQASAYQHAVAARQRLHLWQQHRLAEANPPGGLESSPLAGQAATIIDHRRLLELVAPLSRGPNLLAGGDFESHLSTANSRWRHVARDTGGAPAVVTFADQNAPQGNRFLRIECVQPTGQTVVTIHSPEVPVDAGQLIEITGQVRVERQSPGGSLQIIDSIGGEELALRVDRMSNWQPFRLLRRPNHSGMVSLQFAVRGPVTVGVDGVMLRPIELPGAAKAAVLGVPAFQRK